MSNSSPWVAITSDVFLWLLVSLHEIFAAHKSLGRCDESSWITKQANKQHNLYGVLASFFFRSQTFLLLSSSSSIYCYYRIVEWRWAGSACACLANGVTSLAKSVALPWHASGQGFESACQAVSHCVLLLVVALSLTPTFGYSLVELPSDVIV